LDKSIIVVLYQYIVVDRSLAKVGVEGSNPFARSNDFNALGDRAFVAQSGPGSVGFYQRSNWNRLFWRTA
jgi:hypothetical protein